MAESKDSQRMTRRTFHRKAALATASAVLASSCAPAEENPMPVGKPEDTAFDRLVDEVAAQVEGGLTDAERKRVREQVRGMAGVINALRQAPVLEGAELSSTWAPLLPPAPEDRRKTRTP